MAAKPATLTESSSFLLDIIRLSAALMVLVGHLSHPEFAGVQMRNLQFLGDIAVPIFFVLSGFVIRFVTVSRECTSRTYAIDRASRIYSVALPAMVLTLAVSGLCLLIDRPTYQREIVPVSNHLMLRITLNLTFLSQIWGRNTVQFGNLPFWSLSYECLFYVAYGLFFYLRGLKRVAALILWALVSGPPVVFLFPLWILGCALHDLYQSVRKTKSAAMLRRLTLLITAFALALAALGRPSLLLAPVHLDHAIAAVPNPLALIHEVSIRASMPAVAHGSIAAVAMFLLLLLSDLVPLERHKGFVRRFRRIADGTFAIYLMHYPLMMLARALGLLRPNAFILDTLSGIAIALLLVALAAPLDRFRSTLRGVLGHSFGTVRLPSSAASRPARTVGQTEALGAK